VNPGDKYRIIYHVSGTNQKPREAVFRYVGENATQFIFNARPLGGTQTLNRNWIIAIYETERPLQLPIIHRDEVRVL
jgi:hypothetical protein